MTTSIEPDSAGQRLREHYVIERELSDRLRNATTSDERRSLYGPVYEEFYRRVPWLSYLQPQQTAADSLAPSGQFLFLRRFLTPESVYLEVGPGNCSLAKEVARHVRRVYAVDVSETVMEAGGKLPENVEPVISDGCSIPVPPRSVDVAFSQHLMEHLHPDDAHEQLRNIYRALKPGGRYICITPNGTNGPHDISKHFGDPVATGFHLKEYTIKELVRLFRDVGFQNVDSYLFIKGRFVRLPPRILIGFEYLTKIAPHKLWTEYKQSLLLQVLLLIRIVGEK